MDEKEKNKIIQKLLKDDLLNSNVSFDSPEAKIAIALIRKSEGLDGEELFAETIAPYLPKNKTR